MTREKNVGNFVIKLKLQTILVYMINRVWLQLNLIKIGKIRSHDRTKSKIFRMA